MPTDTYSIHLATALHEASMTRALSAARYMVSDQHSRDRHFAAAIRLILKQEKPRIDATATALTDATGPQGLSVSHATVQLTRDLANASDELNRHMKQTFPKAVRPSSLAISLAMLLYPIFNLKALQHLTAELLIRDPQDPIARAYSTAIVQTALEAPVYLARISAHQQSGAFQSARANALCQCAVAALKQSIAIARAQPQAPDASPDLRSGQPEAGAA